MGRTLGPEQLAAYHRDGFVLLPGFFAAEEIAPLQRFLAADPDVDGALCAIADQAGNAQEVVAYTELGSDYLSVAVRLERMVAAAAAVLGEPCYHWHSKLSMKRPGSPGRWDWHQDYAYWYYDGAVFPKLATIGIAVDRQDPDNGCLQLVRGSHLVGRIDHRRIGQASGVDPDRLARILESHETVACPMQPGDVVVFHCNTLHASGPNRSSGPRTILHCTYNAVSNDPLPGSSPSHACRPLAVAPDDALREGAYSAVVTDQVFTVQTDDVPDGYGYRVLRAPTRRTGSAALSAATARGLLDG